MVKARKYVVKKYFQRVLKKEDFELVEYELPPLKDGEILVKAEWISVDPYLRGFNSALTVPYDQFGAQVGIVEESKAPGYPVGIRVVTQRGWCDYSVVDVEEKSFLSEGVRKLTDLGGLSPSLGVGTVGMTGATAYFGLLEICQPKAGETVVVTGAAGAVGFLVGQIAKIKGCRVIGFAGSDEKVKRLEKELGFDKAINYKTANVSQALKEAAPKGVDCFFDNVGGDLSSVIMSQMNIFGRVSVCGSICHYNDNQTTKPEVLLKQHLPPLKQLKVEGFMVMQWLDRWPEAFAEIVQWIKRGQLKSFEHVTDGFDNVYDALIGMIAGDNFGKAVVKV